MSIQFNADEVFAVAEQIERNGASFYRKCAELNPGQAELLTGLAEMEDSHERTFAHLRSKLPASSSTPTTADPDDESASYIEAMAKGLVFDTTKDPAESIGENASLEEILRTAIGLEKDSVVFYTGIRESVGRRVGRDEIDAIIREELGHIGLLSSMLPA